MKPKTIDELYTELQEVRKEQAATTKALRLVIEALAELTTLGAELTEEETFAGIDMEKHKKLACPDKAYR